MESGQEKRGLDHQRGALIPPMIETIWFSVRSGLFSYTVSITLLFLTGGNPGLFLVREEANVLRASLTAP